MGWGPLLPGISLCYGLRGVTHLYKPNRQSVKSKSSTLPFEEYFLPIPLNFVQRVIFPGNDLSCAPTSWSSNLLEITILIIHPTQFYFSFFPFSILVPQTKSLASMIWRACCCLARVWKFYFRPYAVYKVLFLYYIAPSCC